MTRPLPTLLLSLGLSLALPAGLQARPSQDNDPHISTRILTDSFLRYHPDLKHRLTGLEYLEQGAALEAYREFEKAARYADKMSQGMVAELLWTGAVEGADRAVAYAWMDLAAERGYRTFIVQRERYWDALDAGQRERALEVGQAIYAEYGDEVAKPRLERLLRRGSREITGSRVGFVGPLEILIPGPGGEWVSVSGDEYYDTKLWRPKQYFDWQDRSWGGLPLGRVSVGEIEAEDEDEAKE